MAESSAPPLQRYQSAEVVSTAEGLQYHVNCKPGDVAPYIILVGDPGRVDKVSSCIISGLLFLVFILLCVFSLIKNKVAQHFSTISVRRQNREYYTVTGVYEGIPLTVTSTGIGTDNAEVCFCWKTSF